MEYKYWAFISYSHRDKKWGDWLHRELETYRVPRRLVGRATRIGSVPRRIFPIFRDREELPVSSDLGSNIDDALRLSRNLIVICSPFAAQSMWVNEEIRQFKALGRSDAVQCLIVDGEPNATDKPGLAAAECFPPALRFHLDEAGQMSPRRSEPIAADARPGMDGSLNARLKLLAGILGVGFDELKQREQARRRRQAASIFAGAVLLLAGGIGIWKFEAAQGQRRLEEQRRVQEATQVKEHGRQALLAGDDGVAAADLQSALAVLPRDAGARLMLGAALRGTSGMDGVLEYSQKVTSLILSPDGAYLLAAGYAAPAASLWDLRTKKLLRQIPHFASGQFNARDDKLLAIHDGRPFVQDVGTGAEIALGNGSPKVLTFLGDGTTLLGCEEFSAVGAQHPPQFTVFNASDGRELRHFDVGPGGAGGLQSDSAGATVLAGWFNPPGPDAQGLDKVTGTPWLKWFEVATGKIIADLPRDGSGQMELSPDGERLLYLRPDKVFEARSKTGVLWTVPVLKDLAPDGHWSRGGRYAIVSSFGKTTVFDANTGKALWSDIFLNYAMDDADSVLGYSDMGGTVHIRDLATGRTIAMFSDRIGWPEMSQFPLDNLARFTPGARRLILAGSGREVKVWDWRSAINECSVLGDPKAPAQPDAIFSQDGALLASITGQGSAALWNIAGGRPGAALDSGTAGGVWTAAFSADGKQLLTGSREPAGLIAATLWDTASGKMLAALDDGAKADRMQTRSPMLEQHIRVAFGAGRFVTMNFNLGDGTLWDASTRAKIAGFSAGPGAMELSAPGAGPPRLSVAAGGSAFIVAGFDGVARVFSFRDAKRIASLTHPFPQLAGAELSADGSVALTWSLDGRAAVWDVAQGRKIAAPDPGAASINEIHLSADGHSIAAACSDGCVRVWDTATGALRATFREERSPGEGVDFGVPFDASATNVRGFLSLQFDPGGLWLAAIDDEGRLCVWEIAGGRQILRWGIPPPVHGARLAVSADGHRLALTGIDGAVRIFNLTPAGAP